ncbi:uncharacterized protein [Nicotiana sylvestris]|uniref:Uncharacterized protein isoform X1 n=2 Tax=Nicotiana TaxID=4085 RepID=A0A1S4B1E0_TOBAC|nr:PREDICTED: uncharacterized protein LOC107803443 isoform X1 [Nicotiana tabacum]
MQIVRKSKNAVPVKTFFIIHGSFITEQALNKNKTKMQVVVEIMTGTIFHVQVGDNATVLDLKIAIQNQENLPGDRLILLLDKDGDHMMMNEDQKSLSEYGVQDGSRLYGFFKLPQEENDDDADTGDDKVMDKDRTESDSEEMKNDNAGNNSGSSTPKTPYEEDSVQSPEYVSDSD